MAEVHLQCECRRPAAKRLRTAVTAVSSDAWSVVLDNCDVECLVTLRTTCSSLSSKTEAYARGKAQGWGWRKGDGVQSWVERLGRRVCVFETKTFRCLDPARHDAEVSAAHDDTRKDSVVVGPSAPIFSAHGSKVRITTPGRYLVCATPEPSLSDVARSASPSNLWSSATSAEGGGTSQQQQQPLGARKRVLESSDSEEAPHMKLKRRRLSFKVRVGEAAKAGGSPLKSSVYVGVATRAFSEVAASKGWPSDEAPPQAVRSSDAWLVDLRRGRFVHAYPDYDRRVAAARGAARARALASTDDVAKSGDVVGVRVVDDSVFFYKNGARLAFGCGGGVLAPSQQQQRRRLAGDEDPHPQAQAAAEAGNVAGFDHLGWGRPLPSQDDFFSDPELVPVVEVHAKPDGADKSCDVELEIASWNPDLDDDDEPFRTRLDGQLAYRQRRQREEGEPQAQAERRTTKTMWFLSFLRRRFFRKSGGLLSLFRVSRKRRTAVRRAFRSVVARAPAAAGLAQLSLDFASLALRPDDVRSLRAFCDAFALSVAVSTVWKTHFYDHRRPRRSRRGLRILLKVHLFKCVALAAFAAFFLEPRLASALAETSTCARALPRAVTSAAAWLFSEVAVECALQIVAFFDACRRQLLWTSVTAWARGFLRCPAFSFFLPVPVDETINQNTNQNQNQNGGVAAAPRRQQQQHSEEEAAVAVVAEAQQDQPEAPTTRRTRERSRPQGLAAALRNFPVGHDTPVATVRAVVRFFVMIFIVPGSASLVLALAKDKFLADCATHPAHLLDVADLVTALLYPLIAAWWCFVLLVKFGFLVFGLHALCGFEDYYAPGWLLG